MMLDLYFSAKFKKDYKKMVKRGCNPALLEEVVELLRQQIPLPPKNRDHELSGNYTGYRECHLSPDWLLVYKVDKGELILVLARTGTHSDLF